MISRLRRVPLRNVWKDEAKEFTPWLQENIDVLNEALGLSLAEVKREQSTGNFSVDLVADDGNAGAVAIENQLEKSDHDHLGKLLTYLAAIEARTAIWIMSDPRPEHVRAIAWLNQAGLADFYMVKVEAVRIDDSPPAPVLTLIVGPSEESRSTGQTKKDIASRSRTAWDKDAFLQELRDVDDTLARTAESVIGWAESRGWRVRRGGRTRCNLSFEIDGWKVRPWSLVNDGRLEVGFGYLKSEPPFDDPETREELRSRLGKISEVDLNNSDRYPLFRMSALASDADLNKFFEVCEWVEDQVNEAGALEGDEA